MDFDWNGAIDRNFAALEIVVALLHRLAGIASHRPFVATLPRHLHTRILSILRPAEYALRRLIAIVACRLDVAALPVRRSGSAMPPPVIPASPGAIPAFRLFDPFKPVPEPWLTPGEIAALAGPGGIPAGPGPALPPGEPVDARGVCRRINALRRAMNDLDRQALRLARWRVVRCRPRRWSPLRPGRPPGWTKRPKSDVGEVLKECDLLARIAWKEFDTS
ncbi:MAG: hypothetical protein Kow0026_05100 [Oricola sp.]